jgi:hypothetical protein
MASLGSLRWILVNFRGNTRRLHRPIDHGKSQKFHHNFQH